MNYIDIIIAIPLVWGFIRGLSKGFIIEIASLIALILGIWAGIHFSDFVCSLLGSDFGWDSSYVPLVAFIIIFIVIIIAVFIIAKLLEKVINIIALGFINRLAGAVFGAFKYAVILSILILVLNKYDNKGNILKPQVKDGSLLYHPVEKLVPMLIPKLNIINTEIKDLTKKPTEKENTK